MKRLLRDNATFLGPYFFLVVLSLFWVVSYDKLTLHAYINQFHNSFADAIFPYITHLGDGLTVGLVVALLFFVKVRWALFLGTASLVNSLVVLYLKRVVFADHFRPYHYFKDSEWFHVVSGVRMHENFAFPSGHTAAAFCLYFGLALMAKNQTLKGFFFFIALLASFSRIYLSQHFVEDTLFGSSIGIVLAALSYLMWMRIRPESSFLNNSIFRRNDTKH